MKNLLKADFYSLIRSKLTYILLIICIALPVFSVLTSVLINNIFESEIMNDPEFSEIGGMLFTGRSIMFSSFSLTNNTGLIIPIFIGIFTMSDIRHGTIRNKVIFGKNKRDIYLSHLIVSTVFSTVMSLVCFMVSSLGLIFFDYGVPFDSKELLSFIESLVIGILTFAYIASLSTFFALSTKSLPLTIILTIAVSLLLGIVSSATMLIGTEKYKYIFYSIPTYSLSVVTQTGGIELEIFIFGLSSYLVFIAINTILGTVIFNKTDLK